MAVFTFGPDFVEAVVNKSGGKIRAEDVIALSDQDALNTIMKEIFAGKIGLSEVMNLCIWTGLDEPGREISYSPLFQIREVDVFMEGVFPRPDA